MGFFLLLAKVALETTSAPASQAYTERLFSVCRDLTAGKHNTQQAVRPIVGPPQYGVRPASSDIFYGLWRCNLSHVTSSFVHY